MERGTKGVRLINYVKLDKLTKLRQNQNKYLKLPLTNHMKQDKIKLEIEISRQRVGI